MGWIRVHKINEGVHVQGLEDNLEFDIIIKSISGTQECRKAELRIIGLDNVKILCLSYNNHNYMLLDGFSLGMAKGIDSEGKERQSSLNSVRIYYDVDKSRYDLSLTK